MIRCDIEIEGSTKQDSYKSWGLICMDADERTEAPIKKRESTSYAEEAGEHTDRRTVQDAFDYKVTFAVEAINGSLSNVNAKIDKFNKALYTDRYGSDIRDYKQLTIYHYLNKVKIVGIPEPIAQPKEVFHCDYEGGFDYAMVELNMRVENPKLCDFNLVTE